MTFKQIITDDTLRVPIKAWTDHAVIPAAVGVDIGC